MNNFIHDREDDFEEINIDNHELGKLKTIIEKVLDKHSIKCSKCLKKRRSLEIKHPDADDFDSDDDEPLYQVNKIIGHKENAQGETEFYVQWGQKPFDKDELPLHEKNLARCGIVAIEYYKNLLKKVNPEIAKKNMNDKAFY